MPIGATDTVFKVNGLSSFKRSGKGRNHYSEIIRMDRVVAGPTAYSRESLVGIRQERLICQIKGTGRQ
jgi:hypothetical protein